MSYFQRRTIVSASLICMLMLGLVLPASAATRDDLLASAVRIRYERTEGGALITGHGTAFGIDLSPYGVHSRKLLLSAAHNVLDGRGNPYSTLKIEINEGSRTYWSRCRVVASDDQMDLCLVEAGDELPVLAKLHDTDLQPGSPVILAGSPRGIPVSLYDGEITKRFENGSIRSSARVVFDHGDSGGPFFCARSMKVVGVAVAGVPKNGDLDHNIGLFVPLVGIDSFLQANLPNARKHIPILASKIAPRPIAQKASAESIAPQAAPVAVPAAPVASVAVTPAPAAPVAVAAAKPAPAAPVAPVTETHAEVINIEPAVVAQAVTPAKLPVPEKSVPQKSVEAAPQVAEVKPEAKKSIAAAPAPVAPVAKIAPPAQTAQAKPAAPRAAPVIESDEPPVVAAKVEPKTAKPAKVFHVVQAGENLTKIAKHYNVALTEIVSVNEIQDPNRINIGMKVMIPVQ